MLKKILLSTAALVIVIAAITLARTLGVKSRQLAADRGK